MTADGSPSLKIKLSQESFSDSISLTEAMHHSAGAASETFYIYGEAHLKAQDLFKSEKLNHLVFGLGLGYIEMSIGLLSQFRFNKITTFEKEINLTISFQKWLRSESDHLNSTHDLAFYSIANLVDANKKKSVQEFKDQMLSKELNLELIYKSNIEDETQCDQKYQLIHYDAFSSQTDNKYWSEEWLNDFVLKYADQNCVFASYSKTANLTRVLKKNNFLLVDKKGFSNKRESTLAYRVR